MAHRRTKPENQKRTYGVLVGRIKDGQMDPEGKSPHYEIWIQAQRDYRIAVNVQSQDGSDVLVYYNPDFSNPTKLDLPKLASGPAQFAPLRTGADGEGLDYLRDKIFPLDEMHDIPPEGSGITLANLLDGQIERAKADEESVVIALGQFFSDPGSDKTFGFSPECGVHDIHMMQGNSGAFAGDNRVNGDGALFIRFKGGETIALFTRFTIQDIETNDATGDPTSLA